MTCSDRAKKAEWMWKASALLFAYAIVAKI